MRYTIDEASESQVLEHLIAADPEFRPPLRNRVELNTFASKIVTKATRFEAWSNTELIGLVAVYCNDQKNKVAFVTSVSVLKQWMGNGIAERLMTRCVEHARISKMQEISLEVAPDNSPAIQLYSKVGFVASTAHAASLKMCLSLSTEV